MHAEKPGPACQLSDNNIASVGHRVLGIMGAEELASSAESVHALEWVYRHASSSSEEHSRLRIRLRDAYAHWIRQEPKLTAQHNAEEALWKNIYYRDIEKLRRKLTTQAGDKKRQRRTRHAVLLLICTYTCTYFGFRLTHFVLQAKHASSTRE